MAKCWFEWKAGVGSGVRDEWDGRRPCGGTASVRPEAVLRDKGKFSLLWDARCAVLDSVHSEHGTIMHPTL